MYNREVGEGEFSSNHVVERRVYRGVARLTLQQTRMIMVIKFTYPDADTRESPKADAEARPVRIVMRSIDGRPAAESCIPMHPPSNYHVDT